MSCLGMNAKISCWVLYSLILLPYVISYVVSNTKFIRIRREKESKSSFRYHLQRNDEVQQTKLIIPIFPLTKRVKLPTESIKLRLWEPRYLKLVEYMRNNNPNIDYFGSVYSSHKAQFVGSEYITPILEPGDVGALCQVLKHQDSWEQYEFDVLKPMEEEEEADTASALDEKKDARRIVQLDCIISTRFRIDKILQSGFDDSPYAYPFILVEASTFHDDDIESEETLEIIQRLETTYPKSLWYDCIRMYKNHNGKMDSEQLSFHLASILSTKLSIIDALHLLRVNSSKERLLFLQKIHRFG